MALMMCKDCGREVSHRARFCPHCGRPWPAANSVGMAIVAGVAAAIILGAAVAIFALRADKRPSMGHDGFHINYQTPAPSR